MAEGRSGATGTRTILFTDLVRSTVLRSAVGDVAADKVRREHDRLLREAIARHGGVVAKGLGDGVMAVFEAAADGAACAVAMQQGIDRLRRRRGVELAIRVGLSVGDVGLEGDDWFGMPVVEAARLEAAAAGDQILASELVRLLAGTRTELSFEPVGELRLKGLNTPLAACAIGWEPPSEVSVLPFPPALRTSGFGFVGRDAEQRALASVWESATAGEVRSVLVAGEAGIGKTRLAAEFAALVHGEGAVVLAGRCDEDLAVPYQPFVEALRFFVDHAPQHIVDRLGRYPGELARLVPELVERLPDLPASLRADPETERYRLFEAIASWLAAASEEDPILLILDDLHWATKPTTLLLRHLVRAEARDRVLILGAYRSTELSRDAPLSDFLADLHRDRDAARINLAGLEQAGVAALLADALARPLTVAEAELARRIRADTAGNAFFASEVVRHIGEAATPTDTVAVPDTVREVVSRRLGHLPDAANEVLVAAAVLGTEFDVGVLSDLTARREAEVLGALEEASASQLLEESAFDRYRFAHALVRATIYDGMGESRRARLHRQVADAIQARYADDLDAHVVALAYHLGEVARADPAAAPTALAYTQRAGDQALVRLAPEEAARHYERALDLLEGLPPDAELRCDLFLGLGAAFGWAADFAAARDAYWSAAELARELQDGRRMATAAIGYRGRPRMAGTQYQQRELALFEDALAMLKEHEPALRSLVHAYLSQTVQDAQLAQQHCDDACRLARGVTDPVVVCNALLARASMMFTPAAAREQLSVATRALEVARQSESPDLLLQALTGLLIVAYQLDDRAVAEKVVDELREISERFHKPTYLSVNELLEARCQIERGELDDAERRSAAALTFASDEAAVSSHLAQLMRIRIHQGRTEELLDGSALQLDPSANRIAFAIHLASMVLHIHAGRGDVVQQAFNAILDEDLNALATEGVWTRQLELALLADICTRLESRPGAARLLPLLLPYYELHAHASVAVNLGPFSFYLGTLESVLGSHDDAITHLETARNHLEHTGARALELQARTELGFASTAARNGRAESGYQLLRSARTEAEELGLVDVVRRCDDFEFRLRS